MNKLLPVDYKENLIKKLLKKIRNLFFRKSEPTKEIIEDNEIQLNKNIGQNENTFKSNIKVEPELYNGKIQQRTFIKQVYDKPELLDNLPMEKLEKILEYFQEENKMKRIQLNKLV